HREPDVVEAVDQAMLAERIDLELHLAAVRTTDLLVHEIDGQRRVGAALGVVEQLVEIFLRHADRQDTVLETVVVEDVAERSREQAAEAETEERPRRVLAARAATEIIACDQDLRIAVGRLVENEVRVLAAVILVALFREKAFAKAGALDGLQILLGDD